MLLLQADLDYCNALYVNLPLCKMNKLQYVQNTATRVICAIAKFDHITPVLKSLLWLPVKYRCDYKNLMSSFKSLHDLAPIYMMEMIERYNNNNCGLGSNICLEVNMESGDI